MKKIFIAASCTLFSAVLLYFAVIFIHDYRERAMLQDSLVKLYQAEEGKHRELFAKNIGSVSIDVEFSDFKLFFKKWAARECARSVILCSESELFSKVEKKDQQDLYSNLRTIAIEGNRRYSNSFYQTIRVISEYNYFASISNRERIKGLIPEIEDLLQETPNTFVLYSLICRCFIIGHDYESVIEYGTRAMDHASKKQQTLELLWLMYKSFTEQGKLESAHEIEEAINTVYGMDVKDVNMTIYQSF